MNRQDFNLMLAAMVFGALLFTLWVNPSADFADPFAWPVPTEN